MSSPSGSSANLPLQSSSSMATIPVPGSIGFRGGDGRLKFHFKLSIVIDKRKNIIRIQEDVSSAPSCDADFPSVSVGDTPISDRPRVYLYDSNDNDYTCVDEEALTVSFTENESTVLSFEVVADDVRLPDIRNGRPSEDLPDSASSHSVQQGGGDGGASGGDGGGGGGGGNSGKPTTDTDEPAYDMIQEDEWKIPKWERMGIPHSRTDLNRKAVLMIREGIPKPLRTRIWTALSVLSQEDVQLMSTNSVQYTELLRSTFHDDHAMEFSDFVWHHIRVPTFSTPASVIAPTTFFANRAVCRILCTLAHHFPSVYFAPTLPTLVQFVLSVVSEETGFVVLNSLIGRSLRSRWLLPVAPKRFHLYCTAFPVLLNRKLMDLGVAFQDLKLDIAHVFSSWISTCFATVFTADVVLRVIDMFLSEGFKVFFRVALALLRHRKMDILSCPNGDEMREYLHNLRVESGDEVRTIFRLAFSISLKRLELENIFDDIRDAMPRHDVDSIAPHTFFFLPCVDGQSRILEHPVQFNMIYEWLPERHRVQNLRLLYQTSVHGFSVNTLYNRIPGFSSHIILVRGLHPETREVFVIGAYCPQGWYASYHYYGNGEMFLFTLIPAPSCFQWVRHSNEYFMMGEKDSIALGGGSTGPGLALRSGLRRGECQKCETFQNEVPCVGEFDVLDLEVYVFR